MAKDRQELAVLFAHLGQGFVPLMDILQTLRAIPGPDRELPLFMAVELWQDTGSEVARRIIAQHTQGFVVRRR